MNYVTIKDHRTDGLVAIETYDTDADAVGGFVVCVPDLWGWIWERRPCRVSLRGRDYWLQKAARAAHPLPYTRGRPAS
jgi:hypothetical protein